MKKLSKALSIILCIFTLVMFAGCSGKDKSEKTGGASAGSASAGGAAVHTGTETSLSQDGVTYTVQDGVLTITGSGTVTKEAVSSMLPEYNVVDFRWDIVNGDFIDGDFDIGDDAFNGYTNITDIRLGDNVHNIGERAFKGCSVPIISLGRYIESIEDDAFADCCIESVIINNDYIFENFDDEDDFGSVGANASGIYVARRIFGVGFDPDFDYSSFNDVAGDYLNDNGAFDALQNNTRHSSIFYQRDYYEQMFGDHNFLRVFTSDSDGFHSGYYGDFESAYINLKNYEGYESDGHLNYTIASYFWEDKGIDITFYYTSNLTDAPENNKVCGQCLAAGQSTCQGHPCEICDGVGSMTCSGCGGSGKDPLNKYTDYTCVVCGGAKTQICPNCEGARKVFYKDTVPPAEAGGKFDTSSAGNNETTTSGEISSEATGSKASGSKSYASSQDDSNILLWVIIIVVAVLLLVAVFVIILLLKKNKTITATAYTPETTTDKTPFKETTQTTATVITPVSETPTAEHMKSTLTPKPSVPEAAQETKPATHSAFKKAADSDDLM